MEPGGSWGGTKPALFPGLQLFSLIEQHSVLFLASQGMLCSQLGPGRPVRLRGQGFSSVADLAFKRFWPALPGSLPLMAHAALLVLATQSQRPFHSSLRPMTSVQVDSHSSVGGITDFRLGTQNCRDSPTSDKAFPGTTWLEHLPCRSWGRVQASPFSAVVELVEQTVSQQRAVLIDEQILAPIDAHQQADDVRGAALGTQLP